MDGIRKLLSGVAILFLLALLVAATLITCGEKKPPAKWRVAFSQCTTTEPWRVLFNSRLRDEAAKYPDVELIIADAQDKTANQVAQMENFIRQRVDAILISPKESAGLTDVVAEAYDAGIPVIVLDRGVNTEKYNCFIGGDNLVIGRAAGQYAVEALGGKGKAKGNIVEIWGGMGSTPAQERHAGFQQVIDNEPGIKTVVGRQDGDWKQDKGYNIMETALKAHDKIDLVYAHNDPMAFGAYLAALDAGRADEIIFIGIDGIPEEGCKWVAEGMLDATFLYATPGEKGFRAALKILNGEQVPKKITLPTATITKKNVTEYLQ